MLRGARRRKSSDSSRRHGGQPTHCSWTRSPRRIRRMEAVELQPSDGDPRRWSRGSRTPTRSVPCPDARTRRPRRKAQITKAAVTTAVTPTRPKPRPSEIPKAAPVAAALATTATYQPQGNEERSLRSDTRGAYPRAEEPKRRSCVVELDEVSGVERHQAREKQAERRG